MQPILSSATFSRLAARPFLVVAVLATLGAALYWPPVARTPFFTRGEPREALVVKRITTSGEWILPLRPASSSWTIASKPPLFHWLGAATAHVAGRTTEITVRLPSLLLAVASVVLVGVLGGAIVGPRAALLGAVMLATTFEWMNAAQTARVDATLTAFMTCALLLFYRGLVTGSFSRPAALATYGCLAAASLTKGPVGFVLPGLVLGVGLLVTRRLHLIRAFRPGLGAIVIAAVVGGWYLAAWGVGGEPFFEKHILKENVFRFVGGGGHETGHEHPAHYYLRALAVGFLPWSPVLVAALVAALRSGAERRSPRLGFLLAWFGTIFVFYSLASGKRSIYLLALYPAAALLSGWWLDRLAGTPAPHWLYRRASRVVQGAVCTVLAVPLAVVALEIAGWAPLDLLQPVLHPKDRVNLPIVRSIILGHVPLVVTALTAILAAAALACRALGRARWLRAFGCTAALATAIWVLVFAVFRPEIANRRSLAGFMSWTAAKTDRAALYFYPPSFDFGAAFYASDGVGYLAELAQPTAAPRWVLIWDVDFAALPAEKRVLFEILGTSEGTDPKGKRHMMLARLRPDGREPNG